MPDSDRALMERLAALEAEVKADEDAKRARKDAALSKAKEQRAAQASESAALRDRQTALVTRKPARRELDDDARDDSDDLGGALELARRAHGVKQELSRPTQQGEKSWIKSGVASMLLGPLGWLYAGSMREAVPASAAWLAFGAIASKLIPMFLLMPVLMVILPLSGIAGAMYAVQYNRKGSRQRLFRKKNQQALESGAKKLLKR
ncbi:MAG: hypothetical protein H0T79_14675 [Deltaproteobacteria bacterium]|nr:hypothetical protein [Deltaproteobacteria bacterium]